MNPKAHVEIELHIVRRMRVPVELEDIDDPIAVLEEAQRILPDFLENREADLPECEVSIKDTWVPVPFGYKPAPQETKAVLKLRRRPDGGIEWVALG